MLSLSFRNWNQICFDLLTAAKKSTIWQDNRLLKLCPVIWVHVTRYVRKLNLNKINTTNVTERKLPQQDLSEEDKHNLGLHPFSLYEVSM